jgi:hypothetical protein
VVVRKSNETAEALVELIESTARASGLWSSANTNEIAEALFVLIEHGKGFWLLRTGTKVELTMSVIRLDGREETTKACCSRKGR